MAHRTTLILDEEARAAAYQLARQYGCSVSEAIRRSLVQQRDAVVGAPASRRRARLRTLEQLYDLFADNDPVEEVRRLKSEDERS